MICRPVSGKSLANVNSELSCRTPGITTANARTAASYPVLIISPPTFHLAAHLAASGYGAVPSRAGGLLGTYEAERRPVAAHNVARSADPDGTVRAAEEELRVDLGGRIAQAFNARDVKRRLGMRG